MTGSDPGGGHADPSRAPRSDADVVRAAPQPIPAVDEFSIGNDLAGQRLDVAVAALTGQSRSRAASAIDDGRVAVHGVQRPRSHRLELGQVVAVTQVEPVAAAPPPPLPPIVVADPGFWILDKPAGMVVHPGHGHPDATLADAVRAAGVVDVGPDPTRSGIVHRLDKDTSGLLVVARTSPMHAALVAAMRDRDVTRAYLTLVQGHLPGSHGTVDVPLGRDDRDRTRFTARIDGRHAVTHFRVVATGSVAGTSPAAPRAPVNLVACRLETGRTHQIRVHMAHVGAPVVGDLDYGASADLASRLGLDRMFLHAARLVLAHPETGEVVTATADLPDDLAGALRAADVIVPAAIEWP